LTPLLFYFILSDIIPKQNTKTTILKLYKNMSITYQPKKRKRKRTHGFLRRKKTKAGWKIIRAKIRKGRKRLTV